MYTSQRFHQPKLRQQFLPILLGAFVLAFIALMTARGAVYAQTPQVWMTTTGCAPTAPVATSITVGDRVYIKAIGFSPVTSYPWKIFIGVTEVAGGNFTTDSNGTACVDTAYIFPVGSYTIPGETVRIFFDTTQSIIVVQPTPTPTSTSTSTLTPTVTQTPTITLTPSITPTSSITPTASRTPTVTRTPTITRTPTLTPTITQTPTITLTPSTTPTVLPVGSIPPKTNTPLVSATPLVSPTPLKSATPAKTSTPSVTPSRTPTPRLFFGGAVSNNATPTFPPIFTRTPRPTVPTSTLTNTPTRLPDTPIAVPQQPVVDAPAAVSSSLNIIFAVVGVGIIGLALLFMLFILFTGRRRR